MTSCSRQGGWVSACRIWIGVRRTIRSTSRIWEHQVKRWEAKESMRKARRIPTWIYYRKFLQRKCRLANTSNPSRAAHRDSTPALRCKSAACRRRKWIKRTRTQQLLPSTIDELNWMAVIRFFVLTAALSSNHTTPCCPWAQTTVPRRHPLSRI